MASTSNPLIDVDFVDQTNYTAVPDTSDVVGMVVEANWGECDKPIIYDSTTWASTFNPSGMGRINYSYSCLFNAFKKGASYVEVVRLSANEQWAYITVSYADSTLSMASDVQPYANSAYYGDLLSGDVIGVLRLKYAGGFPITLSLTSSLSGTRTLQSAVKGTQDVMFQLNVYAGTEATGNPLETLQFTFTKHTLSGVSYFYADVINSQSVYLSADTSIDVPDVTFPTWTGSGSLAITTSLSIAATATTKAYAATDYVSAYQEYFGSHDVSDATLLVNTYNGVGTETEDVTTVQNAISAIAETRMDCVALQGLPTAWVATNWNASMSSSLSTFAEYFSQIDAADKFTGFLVAQESVTIGNMVFLQDGTAGWAGRICSVAESLQNRNQLPSYKQYGSYSGVLVKTLKFEDVVTLHQDYGIGSIYSSKTGNFIFNIMSSYGIRTSYFGKLNVMRVIAAVLSWAFDEVDLCIHTAAASDPQARLNLQARLNTLLGQMISRRELKSQSNANVGDSLNTDALTNGGELLVVEITLWPYKLTEKVTIRIVTTDSSVESVELS